MGDENYVEEEAEQPDDQPRVDREPDSAPIPANPNPSAPEPQVETHPDGPDDPAEPHVVDPELTFPTPDTSNEETTNE